MPSREVNYSLDTPLFHWPDLYCPDTYTGILYVEYDEDIRLSIVTNIVYGNGFCSQI